MQAAASAVLASAPCNPATRRACQSASMELQHPQRTLHSSSMLDSTLGLTLAMALIWSKWRLAWRGACVSLGQGSSRQGRRQGSREDICMRN